MQCSFSTRIKQLLAILFNRHNSIRLMHHCSCFVFFCFCLNLLKFALFSLHIRIRFLNFHSVNPFLQLLAIVLIDWAMVVLRIMMIARMTDASSNQIPHSFHGMCSSHLIVYSRYFVDHALRRIHPKVYCAIPEQI